MTGLQLYVGYTDQSGVVSFDTLDGWLDLDEPCTSPRIIRGVSRLMEWFNQERHPGGGLHRLVQTPKGLVVKRLRPGPGYWIAEPIELDQAEIEAAAARYTKHDAVKL